MTARFTITFHLWSASHCSMRETLEFLDKWRHREGGYLRVTAHEYAPVDEDDDGLTTDEREAVSMDDCEARRELVERIDSKSECAA